MFLYTETTSIKYSTLLVVIFNRYLQLYGNCLQINTSDRYGNLMVELRRYEVTPMKLSVTEILSYFI